MKEHCQQQIGSGRHEENSILKKEVGQVIVCFLGMSVKPGPISGMEERFAEFKELSNVMRYISHNPTEAELQYDQRSLR